MTDLEQTLFLFPVSEAEPHRVRRRTLLRTHPEVRELFGHSYAAGVVIALIVGAQVASAWWVTRGADGWLMVAMAFVVGGTLNHWAGMGIHESAHDLVAKTRLGNRLVGFLANIPIVFPAAASFRRHHLLHHSHMGVEGKDNDLASAWEIRWVGRSPWRKLLWMAGYLFFAIFARGFLKPLTRWEVANLVFSLCVGVAIYWGMGPMALAYLLLSTFFGFSLLHPAAAHFIHEHYIWIAGQETYSYYGPLNWVSFNVGYHNEHHDLMGIPGWKLPRLRRLAPELYEPLVSHRSWIGVLWHFVTQPGIGHESRIVRPAPGGVRILPRLRDHLA